MSENIVRLPSSYYGDPNQNRPVFNGSVYIGKPDTDPEIEVNRLPVTLKQEDGTLVPIAISAQPLVTGSGGYVTYDGGSPEVLVAGNYSIKVLSSGGDQEFYFQNVLDGAPFTNNAEVVKNFATLALAVADTGLVEDDALNLAEHSAGNGGGAVWDVIAGVGTATWVGRVAHDTLDLTLVLRDLINVNVKQVGVQADGTDDRAVLQSLLDNAVSNSNISFAGCEQVEIASPIALMGDSSWRDGFTAEDRANITVDLAGCEIIFADTVVFQGIFADTPINTRVQTEAATITRQPGMFYVSGDGFNVIDGTLNANMQARAANLGNPGVLEGEHCLRMIACRNSNATDLITKDSMGDGINIGYPYTTGDAPGSAFFGSNSLDGICQNCTTTNTQGYRHSRLAMSVVGGSYITINNAYGEEINSITNFTSAVGPGATIDLEYDVSQSLYSGDGFSIVEHITVNGVHGKDNSYGGAIQVQNARHVQINDVTLEGDSLFGFGRFEGDSSTVHGAKHVAVDGVLVTSDTTNSGTLVALSGEDVHVNNVHIDAGGFVQLVRAVETSNNVTLSNVTGNPKMGDSTGVLVRVLDGAQIKLSNIDLELDSTSAIRNPFLLEGVGLLELDNVKVSASDSTVMSALGRGVFHFEDTLGVVVAKDINMQFKSASVISQSNVADVNSVTIDGGKIRGCIIYPSAEAISTIDIKEFDVESCYNDGGASATMLNLYLRDDQTIKLKDIGSDSTGKFSFNKCKTAGFVRTDHAAFATLSNCSIDINGLIHRGGRDSDDAYAISALANAVLVTDPWDVAAVTALFTVSGVDINDSTHTISTLANATTVHNINLITEGNWATWPNAYHTVTMLEAGAGAFHVQYAWLSGFSNAAGTVITTPSTTSTVNVLIASN